MGDTAQPAGNNNLPAVATGPADWFKIRVPNLRNGQLEYVVDAAPMSTIPSQSYWVGIKDLPSAVASKFIPQLIKAHYGQLSVDVANRDQANVKEELRRQAIVLGTARAVIQEAHRMTVADITAGELRESTLVYSGGETDAQYEARQAALTENTSLPAEERAAELENRRAALARNVGTVSRGAGNETSTSRATREEEFGTLSADEQDVVHYVAWLAVPIALLQGVSLIQTSHHYTPATYKLFDGHMKQADFLTKPTITNFKQLVGTNFKDWLFHKAAHPVIPARKMKWSTQPENKKMLERARLGAAAIRLPGIPLEMQPVRAGLAVIMKAKPNIERMGGTVALDAGLKLLLKVESPDDSVRVSTTAALDKAIKEAAEWFASNQGHIAFSAGIVDKMRQMALATAERQLAQETTTSAYSVQRAVNQNMALYGQGMALAEAMAKRDKDLVIANEKISYEVKA
jgi:hypothetical protein